MNIDDVTPEELINLRNIAERESFYADKEVLFEDVLRREYALSLVGMSKYISKKSKIEKPVEIDNINKQMIVDFSDGDLVRIKLVENADLNSDTKQISINSPVGRMLRTMKVDDIQEYNGLYFTIVKIFADATQAVSN
jgi:transcription elongation GreA/GreB family factor